MRFLTWCGCGVQHHFELIQQNFFPLFTASFLEHRWKSRTTRDAQPNVCKEVHMRLKSRTPFNRADIEGEAFSRERIVRSTKRDACH